MTPALDKPAPDRRPRKMILEAITFWKNASEMHKRERDEARELNDTLGTRVNAVTADNKALEKRMDEKRKDFADLKARLLAAELVNAEMRGYITRLQEDDVVREELVTTGDPNGQQRMVPKRKHRTFEGPNQMTNPRDRHEFDETMSRYAGQREERKPRCWVEY